MKNFKTFLFFLGSIIYFELLFKFINFGFDFNFTFIYSVFFSVIVSLIFTIICGMFKPKVNKILFIVSLSIITLWYGIEIIFRRIFNTFFSLSFFKLADQATSFIGTAIEEILKNIVFILLLLVPIAIYIIFRKKIKFKKTNIITTSLVLILYVLGMVLPLKLIDNEANELFYKVNNLDLNMNRFGVLITTYLDLKKSIFGFEEEIKVTIVENEPKEVLYDYNNMNYDFEKLLLNNNDSNIKLMTEYFRNDKGTLKNEYTGIFEGKNLVFFMAESFNEIAVDEELTPTLYKLVNSGFTFENFYTPLNLSTIGGEFQDLTGLMANSSTLSTWRSGKNYFPYGLGNVFKKLGYNVNAYHNNSYSFQDRNLYLKASGFDNYLGRYNGLEKRMSFSWPASDYDMVKVTMDDYVLSDEPFMTYYVTVSGHMAYTTDGNSMARKNWDAVKNLNYSSDTKAYLATQIELDKALEYLINRLEECGKLDDTVIVLVADHYPYALSLSHINEVLKNNKDSVIEINRSNLILWNNKMENVKVEKVASQIDVIPTVYNLFGIDYDSRLFVGKDILSTEPGLAIFSNRSWVSDYGKYYSSNNKFVLKEGMEVSDEYVSKMNNIVSNKLNMSKLIISKNYYEVAKKYLIDDSKKYIDFAVENVF